MAWDTQSFSEATQRLALARALVILAALALVALVAGFLLFGNTTLGH
jgi:ABC-type Na+ efflux pump permease subunit